MRHFSARETEWLQELDGIELAGFWRRAFAFALDWVLLGVLLVLVTLLSVFMALTIHLGHLPQRLPTSLETTHDSWHLNVSPDGSRIRLGVSEEVGHLAVDLLIPVLYFGVLTWAGKGRSPGKRLLRIRVVSLVHRHLTLWHATERALGYGAAALEGGFGFVQFFIHPYRRCVQDRIAETIVVTERSYRSMRFKQSHALIPDVGNEAVLHQADELPPPDEEPVLEPAATEGKGRHD